MSSRQSGAKKKKSGLWIVLILVIVGILGIVIALNQGGAKQEPSTEQSEESKTASEVTQTPEDGEEQEDTDESDAGPRVHSQPYYWKRLQVDSLFQYSGINPDAQNAECEDVASIQMKNNSEQYLESAEISVELTDGSAYSFTVQDIPAGKTVMAFDTANASYDGKIGVAFIDAKTSYSSDTGVKEDTVKITSDDNGIQLENISGNALADLKIKYHCILDDMYFGGISSETEVDGIDAGESIVVDTSDSILGDAEIVSITY